MSITEIPAHKLNTKQFIRQKVQEIAATVGDATAITALSGGVDSSVVTVLGHRALGDRLLVYFIENGLMRQDEPARVARLFGKMGIQVRILDARSTFFDARKVSATPRRNARPSRSASTSRSLARW